MVDMKLNGQELYTQIHNKAEGRYQGDFKTV